MELGQAAHERETDAQAFLDALGKPVRLREKLEDAAPHLRPDPDAVVADADHGLLAVARDREVDRPGARRVLGRVAQEVGKDLLQARGIGLEQDRLGR